MAEEKKSKAPAKETESKGKKFINWWKKLPKRIATPFKNMWYELKQVTWPTKNKLITYSIAVFVVMLVLGIVIGLLDMGASALVRQLVQL